MRLVPNATAVTDLRVTSGSVLVRAALAYTTLEDASGDARWLQQLSTEALSSMLDEKVEALTVSLESASEPESFDVLLVVLGGAVLTVGLICVIAITFMLCMRCSAHDRQLRAVQSNAERTFATAQALAAAKVAPGTPLPRPALRRAYSSLDDHEFAARYAHHVRPSTSTGDVESSLTHLHKVAIPQTSQRNGPALERARESNRRTCA